MKKSFSLILAALAVVTTAQAEDKVIVERFKETVALQPGLTRIIDPAHGKVIYIFKDNGGFVQMQVVSLSAEADPEARKLMGK